jgi:hypothetical protein
MKNRRLVAPGLEAIARRATDNSPRRKPWVSRPIFVEPLKGAKEPGLAVNASHDLTPPFGGSHMDSPLPNGLRRGLFSYALPGCAQKAARFCGAGIPACAAAFQRHQPGDARPGLRIHYTPPCRLQRHEAARMRLRRQECLPHMEAPRG